MWSKVWQFFFGWLSGKEKEKGDYIKSNYVKSNYTKSKKP